LAIVGTLRYLQRPKRSIFTIVKILCFGRRRYLEVLVATEISLLSWVTHVGVATVSSIFFLQATYNTVERWVVTSAFCAFLVVYDVGVCNELTRWHILATSAFNSG
jgi:hypothetical protein